jgi:hypothetical protein
MRLLLQIMYRKSSHALGREIDINGDKMRRLVPNAVPITSNYEEITLSNDDTITGENLLALKTNIEMRLRSKYKKWGWI